MRTGEVEAVSPWAPLMWPFYTPSQPASWFSASVRCRIDPPCHRHRSAWSGRAAFRRLGNSL